MDTQLENEAQLHRKYAVDLFNFTWELLEKPDRTVEEDDRMLHAAHASRYHWGMVGEAVNLARGEWQVSRVYSVLKREEPARYHAQRCLDICQQNGIGDFDLAYAYEALARAAALCGDALAIKHYLELARLTGEQIAEEDDRQLFFNDLSTIPSPEPERSSGQAAGRDPDEETLDPQDWQAMRALGRQMVDDTLTFLEKIRERPPWQPIPKTVKTFLNQPVPLEPEPAEDVYQEFIENILPYPLGNIHPRFWGWVIGTGTPMGVLSEMLAAGMNPNLGGGDHVANYVETQVINWCKSMLGFPEGASGLLVSGGSMANLVGLTVARNTLAGYPLREQGVRTAPAMLTLYGSTEMHSSIQKAVELLGLGNAALRKIPVNADFQIDIAALEAAIAADRAAGHQPFCIVGNAGTVNTGAIDDLARLADICQREGLWFHVDGAFGALAAISPALQPRITGMERADSLAFDLHKWMYMPMEVGCALVRREEDHRHAFSLTPDYLTHDQRGASAGQYWFSDYGIQLTRGFRALKVWMSLKEHGLQKYARMLEKNVAQAAYLGQRVEATPELELLAPIALNLVCYRFVDPRLDDETLNELNHAILIELHERGIAVPSSTRLNGKFAIRVANVNHRSQRQDFDFLAQETVRLGKELVEQYLGEAAK